MRYMDREQRMDFVNGTKVCPCILLTLNNDGVDPNVAASVTIQGVSQEGARLITSSVEPPTMMVEAQKWSFLEINGNCTKFQKCPFMCGAVPVLYLFSFLIELPPENGSKLLYKKTMGHLASFNICFSTFCLWLPKSP